MKRKILAAAVVLSVAGAFVSCGGNDEKVRTFAENVAGYVLQNQVDSLKAVYPVSNFDSLAPLETAMITVEEDGEGYKIMFGDDVWMNVASFDDGTLCVVNSKGIAAFPEEKYRLAIESGMFNDSIDDIKKQEMLNDNDYFEWLNGMMTERASTSIDFTLGKERVVYWTEAEGFDVYQPVTVINKTDRFISGNDYDLAYTVVKYDGTEGDTYSAKRSRKGIDLAPGASGKIEIKEQVAAKFKNVRIDYKNKSTNNIALTGSEYQEYLDAKK